MVPVAPAATTKLFSRAGAYSPDPWVAMFSVPLVPPKVIAPVPNIVPTLDPFGPPLLLALTDPLTVPALSVPPSIVVPPEYVLSNEVDVV